MRRSIQNLEMKVFKVEDRVDSPNELITARPYCSLVMGSYLGVGHRFQREAEGR